MARSVGQERFIPLVSVEVMEVEVEAKANPKVNSNGLWRKRRPKRTKLAETYTRLPPSDTTKD
jgi:hypothetical protein